MRLDVVFQTRPTVTFMALCLIVQKRIFTNSNEFKNGSFLRMLRRYDTNSRSMISDIFCVVCCVISKILRRQVDCVVNRTRQRSSLLTTSATVDASCMAVYYTSVDSNSLTPLHRSVADLL